MVNAGCRIVKLVNDFGPANEIDPAKATIVGRRISVYPDDQDRVVTAENLRHIPPVDAASLFVNIQRETYQLNPKIRIWEGPNEPVWGNTDDMAWYAQFEIERMRLMDTLGLKAVIANFSTGNPGDLSWWSAFLPALAYARDHGHYFGLHEYGGVWMWWMTGPYQVNPNENEGIDGWTTLRYRKIYRQYLIPADLGDVKLIITECGLDRVGPSPAGFTSGNWRYCAGQWNNWDGHNDPIDYWRGAERDAEHYYAEQLLWYDRELKKDPYVVGATIFTVGNMGPPWDQYDIEGTRVMDYLISHIDNVAPIPIPVPTPQGDSMLNGNFEDGYYLKDGVPELAIPNSWDFWYAPAGTPHLDRQSQDFNPPEAVVWNRDQAPANERDVFWLSGQFCLKVFAGWKPIWWKLFQRVTGFTVGRRYLFTTPVFPDLVMDYDSSNNKIWADDPLAGEVRLSAVSGAPLADSGWLNGSNFEFGKYSEHTLLFTADATEVEVALECRGRWGLINNGFFCDSLRLEAVGSPVPVPTPTPPPATGTVLSEINTIVTAVRGLVDGVQSAQVSAQRLKDLIGLP